MIALLDWERGVKAAERWAQMFDKWRRQGG